MKRSRAAAGEAGAAKVPRVQEPSQDLNRNSSQDEEDEYDEKPWPLKVGMLMEITLTNFMCHEKYRFVPNQRLNFLCGENGSGKSAVLTAVVFGLGGTAKMTNRGSSNKGFIRSGQNSASVEIRLCNVGVNQFRGETYGDSITILRTVTLSSSTYKLKNHAGRNVDVPKPKEEIDKILYQFNIQVENPIVVLNQDTSKTFLAKADPDKLYQFFNRSTQLKDVEAHYASARLNKEISVDTFKKKNDSLPELHKEFKTWTRKWVFHEQLSTKKNELRQSKAELSWAIVRDRELEIVEVDKLIEKENKKVGLADKEIEAITKKDKDKRAEKKQIEKEIQNTAATFTPEKDRQEELKKVYDEKARKTKQSTREVGEVQRKIGKTEKMLKQVTDEIDKYKNGKCREYEEKRLTRIRKLKEVVAEIEALTAQIETSGNHLNHLKSDKRTTEQAAANAKYEINSKNVKIEKLKDDLRSLESGEKNKLKTYGEFMPRLVSEIQNCRKFEMKPIGPLGAHIVLKDNLPKEMSAVIEGELGGMMTAFCCNSNRDQMVLYDIFKRLKIARKPVVITSEFSTEPYDISRKRVNSDKYTTLIDCIETTDPTVFNTLVDNVQLEKIIAISSAAEAQRILKNPETVPRNLKYAIVEAKHQYFPAPRYRSYYKEYRSRNLLKSSIEELIAEMKDQLVVEQEEADRHRQQQAGLLEKVKSSNQLVEAEERKIRSIRGKLTEKNMLRETLSAEEYAEKPPDIAALEDDKEKFVGEVAKLKLNLKEAVAANAEDANAEAAAKAEHDELEKALASQMERIEQIEKLLGACEEGIRKNKRDIDHYNAKKVQYKEQGIAHAKVKEEKEAMLQEMLKRAQKWCEERIVTKKTTDALTKEAAKLSANLEKQGEMMEPRDFVKAKYQNLKDLYEKTCVDMKNLEVMLNQLDNSIQHRKKGFKMILRSTSQNVQRCFTTQLTSRNFTGNINFRHRDKVLEIVVNPASQNQDEDTQAPERDLRSLSGGERSFTLVCFILSLWNVMNSPFRILDEFDVFMDACNRRISVANMINYAREDRKNQFIFLTPLDTNNIEVNQDLKIIKLLKRTG